MQSLMLPEKLIHKSPRSLKELGPSNVQANAVINSALAFKNEMASQSINQSHTLAELPQIAHGKFEALVEAAVQEFRKTDIELLASRLLEKNGGFLSAETPAQKAAIARSLSSAIAAIDMNRPKVFVAGRALPNETLNEASLRTGAKTLLPHDVSGAYLSKQQADSAGLEAPASGIIVLGDNADQDTVMEEVGEALAQRLVKDKNLLVENDAGSLLAGGLSDDARTSGAVLINGQRIEGARFRARTQFKSDFKWRANGKSRARTYTITKEMINRTANVVFGGVAQSVLLESKKDVVGGGRGNMVKRLRLDDIVKRERFALDDTVWVSVRTRPKWVKRRATRPAWSSFPQLYSPANFTNAIDNWSLIGVVKAVADFPDAGRFRPARKTTYWVPLYGNLAGGGLTSRSYMQAVENGTTDREIYLDVMGVEVPERAAPNDTQIGVVNYLGEVLAPAREAHQRAEFSSFAAASLGI